ncbi:phospholipase effector Tle1 domain-containing protein [Citrobacter farmeri]|uniref:DUF2235 domain-containing protein n=1 Tax=Citrobacter amalonaticus Y19 TaxID=1261127 RepID=A0A0F6RFF7_CITAM|nr:DUF2235 domain-containing protein [Citrobacter amalonaticus]AKE59113.1 hypothetical protein F384_11200 [Citrobacter amalonaticus Y19]EKV5657552.1 DUF2235 domain-containing protein [Citrobacter farmeri]
MIDESAISAATRAQQAEDHHVGNCGRVWHVAFFFDGVGRNIDQDAPDHRLSNIARLFRAYPDKDKNTSTVCFNAFYFSGMGTPYHDDAAEKIYSVMDISLGNLLEDVKKLPKDTVSDAGMDIARGKKWTDVLGNALEYLNNPLEWARGVGKMALSALGKAGIESTPWLRDNEVMSAHFMTGEPTRLTAAKRQFKKFYKENTKDSNVTIKTISVSLYGFDLGATLARKFLDQFLKEICQKNKAGKYQYKNVPVDIVFTGLFDCSRHSPASSNNGLDYFFMWLGMPGKMIGLVLGDKAIDQDSPLPDAVCKALHLAAAHERRPWRGLYLLGNTAAKKAERHQELLLPGCSEDIGGGLKPDEQKPSAELCRVALYNMYHAACQAGVPFPDFEDLPVLSKTIASYFLMNDAVQGMPVTDWVSRYQKEVKENTFSDTAQEKHLDNYFLWLGEQYYMYQYERERLDKELSLAQREQISGYGPLAGTGINPNTKADAIKAQISELDSLWGWLDEVKRVAVGLHNDFRVSPRPNDRRMELQEVAYNAAVNRAETFLTFAHAAYHDENMPMSSSSTANTLYSYFVHDIQKVDYASSVSEDFFLRRSAELPDVDSESSNNKNDGKKHSRRDD